MPGLPVLTSRRATAQANAIEIGSELIPSGTVEITVFEPVSITDTVLDTFPVTHIWVPFAAIPVGIRETDSEPVTAPRATLITETVSSPELVT